ncbi:MAG: hypothetical protein GXO64_02255 [Candidatus Micrarchaeota archaeon]|nr:hypothetical protein [Candidatus Micrarchaeota archaeon]
MPGRKSLLLLAFMAVFLIASAPFASADMMADAEALKGKLSDFVGANEAVIVKGSYTSVTENALFYAVSKTYDELSDIPVVDEKEYDPAAWKGKVIILIGGPVQNGISRELMKKYADNAEEIKLSAGRAVFIDAGDIKAIIFSDNEGFDGIRKARENSPLAPLVSPEMVPVAATGVGTGLLIFWKFLAGLLTKVMKFKAASKIMKKVKKRELKKSFLGKTIRGVRIKVREWASILISALIFAVSLSYIYLSPGMDIPVFLLLTVLVNFIVYSIRHGMRLVLDKHYGHHTEYHIWYKGAIITAITGWLGNTFSLAGYIVGEKKEENEGKVSFIINMATFAAFIVFWIWNFLEPNLIVHMAMLLTLAIAFLQMLPVSPFSGKGIFGWNKKLWMVGFAPLLIAYVLVNVI